MAVLRVHQKSVRIPEELAELRAVRERYQREKPSPEEALAQSGNHRLVPLGDTLCVESQRLEGQDGRKQTTLR